MIVPNMDLNQVTLPVRHVSDDAPRVVATTPKQIAPQPPTSQQLANAVGSVNLAMRQSSQNLEFSVDANTKKPIVKMVDSSTGEVIRQIPSEEMLAIARSIDQFLLQHQFQHGLLLKQQA